MANQSLVYIFMSGSFKGKHQVPNNVKNYSNVTEKYTFLETRPINYSFFFVNHFKFSKWFSSGVDPVLHVVSNFTGNGP